MPTIGRPKLTVRMDRAEIDALLDHAHQNGTTYGDIVRKLVHDYMDANGITPKEKPIDGQISTNDLDV